MRSTGCRVPAVAVFVSVACVVVTCVRAQVHVKDIKVNVATNDIKPANTNKPTRQATATAPAAVAKPRQASARETLICPGNGTTVPLFTLPCERTEDCKILGPGLVCCQRPNILFKRCLKGVPAPKPEPVHEPWLRVFPRKCPETPIAEFREVKNCTTDEDCSPRICCPEPGTSDGYCRTAALHLDNFPTVKRMLEPITNLMGYLQCTSSPSPLLDLFQRECQSPIDCFPNLCCQERGRKVCRPPRQSFLSLLTGVTRSIATSSSQRTSNLINNFNNNNN